MAERLGRARKSALETRRRFTYPWVHDGHLGPVLLRGLTRDHGPSLMLRSAVMMRSDCANAYPALRHSTVSRGGLSTRVERLLGRGLIATAIAVAARRRCLVSGIGIADNVTSFLQRSPAAIGHRLHLQRPQSRAAYRPVDPQIQSSLIAIDTHMARDLVMRPAFALKHPWLGG